MHPDDMIVNNPPAKRAIPSLDGLRAVSIALVVLSHSLLRVRVGERVARLLDCGWLGVQVFFVISGFLITTLLLRELDRSGSIHLPRFYFRRVLRIFPAYYTYLIAIAALGTAGLLATADVRWPAVLSYTSNVFFLHQSWIVGHSWSLSVEEQFYVLWPACLVLLGRRGATKVAIAVLLLSPAARLAIFLITRNAPLTFIPGFDAIATGCLLALHWPRLQHDAYLLRVVRSRAFVLVPVSAWLIATSFMNEMRWLFLADILLVRTYVAIALALTVAWCMLNATGAVGRVLNAAPVRALGVLSYSLYLWQQLFTWQRFPIAVWLAPVAALAAAAVSYYLVESPGLRLRETLERRFDLFVEPAAPETLTVASGAAA